MSSIRRLSTYIQLFNINKLKSVCLPGSSLLLSYNISICKYINFVPKGTFRSIRLLLVITMKHIYPLKTYESHEGKI